MYSSDTRPCDSLVRLGNQMKPGRILIHEATFDDSAPMRREAEASATRRCARRSTWATG